MPLPPALASTSLAALKSSTAVVKVFQKIDQTPLRRWLLMQNKSIDKRIAMPELPWSSHWAYFQGFDGGEFALSDASPDGLLPVLDARRRWAGGSFTYDADAVNAVRVGDLVQRSTRIAQVQEKRGRSGQFAVLTIEDSFRVLARSSAALALSNDVAVMNDFANIDAFRALQPLVYPKSAFTETREIVYPLKPFPAPTAVEPKDMSLALNIEQESMTGLFKGCQAVHELRACPDLLFRFSALTNNDHRIHYDAEYAKREEGLPGYQLLPFNFVECKLFSIC
jgi:3-methylfumaryl-CoA hydratase